MQEGSQDGHEVSSADLRICFTPGLEQLAQSLAAGLQAGAPTVFAPADMLALTTAGKVIVLWRGLDRALDDCLSNGQSAASAISAWMEEADGLLNIFRQHRRQVILVKADSFQHGGAGVLAEWLGHAEFPLPAISAPAPIARAMALLAAVQDGGLARLAEELQSASLPAPELQQTDILEDILARHSETRRDLTLLADRLAETERTATGLGDEQARLIARHQEVGHSVALLQAELAAANAAKAAAETDLGQALEEAELLRIHVGLVEENLTAPLAVAEAETAALRIAALQSEVAVQDRITADLAARIAEREHDAGLLQRQIGQADDSLAQQMHKAEVAAEAAAAQIRALEAQLTSKTKAAAELAARLAGHETEAGLLQTQVELLQDSLALLLQDNADRATDASLLPLTARTPAPVSEEFDKALSRALAAARDEAVLRAGMEKELNALKARQQHQATAEGEVGHHRKMLAQMTKESIASLDQIARLSAAHKTVTAERDAVLAELAQLRLPAVP